MVKHPNPSDTMASVSYTHLDVYKRQGLLLPGYIPTFFLFLELDPEKVDVNIHPQKTEVKFEDENLIYALIRSTIKKSLGIYNVAPSLDFDRDSSFDAFVSQKSGATAVLKAPEINVDRNYNPFREESSAGEKLSLIHI